MFSDSLHLFDFSKRIAFQTQVFPITMKDFSAIILVCFWLSNGCSPTPNNNTEGDQLPNIVYIMADDLGYQELGSYGQQIIKTPHLDKLASEGMRFTQHYSGSTVCAPSRCTLLTGKHTGNSFVRDNYELGDFSDENEKGQLPLPEGGFTLGKMLKEQGYNTGVIGKWGLGGPGSTGIPGKQGFDYFYGYLCQKQAHNYYPTHLWENEVWDTLENEYFIPHQKFEGDPTQLSDFKKYKGNEYAQDVMAKKALDFIDRNQDHPFFLYLPFPVPHLSLQVPDESLEQYHFNNETPYLGERSYLPHRFPLSAYAGMITRMDQQIGNILAKLESCGLTENTIIVFTSDNGTTFDIGGVDRKFFNSLGDLKGHKTTLYEGGIRVPFLFKWPGKVAPGTVSDHISANWDIVPTLAEITKATPPEDIDGISLLPELLNKDTQKEHQYLYWEFHGRWDGAQAVRLGNWKAVRLAVGATPQGPIELYNLAEDIGESHDVATQNPEVIQKIKDIMRRRTSSHIETWNFNGNQL